jgi:multiple sugar transport system substrate-binding protein
VDDPWEVYFAKATTEIVAGTAAYDIVWMDTHFAPAFAVLNAVQAIDDLIERDKAELHIEDFSPVHVEYATWGGKNYGFQHTFSQVSAWGRKDLFEDPKEKADFKKKYGYDLAPPKTWIEFNDIAEFFTRPPNMYGHAQPLVWAQLFFPWFHTIYGCVSGKPLADENWHPTFNSPEGVLAVDLIKYQLKHMPPGILTMDNPDAHAVYVKGQAAMTTGWPDFVNEQLLKPEAADIASKTFMLLPPVGGPKGWTWYTNCGHLMGISATAKGKAREAAWAVIKEVDGREGQKRNLLKAGASPARMQIWSDPDVVKKMPWMNGGGEYFKYSYGFTLSEYVGDLVGIAPTIHSAVSGEMDVDKALAQLAKDWDRILQPYRDKGIKNTHGLSPPKWPGEDYTNRLKEQIYG